MLPHQTPVLRSCGGKEACERGNSVTTIQHEGEFKQSNCSSNSLTMAIFVGPQSAWRRHDFPHQQRKRIFPPPDFLLFSLHSFTPFSSYTSPRLPDPAPCLLTHSSCRPSLLLAVCAQLTRPKKHGYSTCSIAFSPDRCGQQCTFSQTTVLLPQTKAKWQPFCLLWSPS